MGLDQGQFRPATLDIAADRTEPAQSALVALGFEFDRGRIASNGPDHCGLGVVRIGYDGEGEAGDLWQATDLQEAAQRPQPLRQARAIAFDPHRINRAYVGTEGCGVAVGVRRPAPEQ